MNILLTGGAGYIGSHTCVMLQKIGFSVVIYDNLSNSNLSTIQNINKISGTTPDFVKGDILDFDLLKSTIRTYDISAVIHFAGLKSVKESIEKQFPVETIHSSMMVCMTQEEIDVLNQVKQDSKWQEQKHI